MSQQRNHLRGHDPYMDVWHRRDSLSRFVGKNRATWMSQIDIDSCEYCHLCSEPIALVETKTIWARSKNGTVTAKLAERASLSAYLVEYQTHGPALTCSTCGRPNAIEGDDILRFLVSQWHPKPAGDNAGRREMYPVEYANWLWSLRFGHWRVECNHPLSVRMLSEGVA